MSGKSANLLQLVDPSLRFEDGCAVVVEATSDERRVMRGDEAVPALPAVIVARARVKLPRVRKPRCSPNPPGGPVGEKMKRLRAALAAEVDALQRGEVVWLHELCADKSTRANLIDWARRNPAWCVGRRKVAGLCGLGRSVVFKKGGGNG